jgi:hypothetical protein
MESDRPEQPAAPAAKPPAELPTWNALLIEDNPDTVRQIEEFFQNRNVSGRRMVISPITNWDDAFGLIRGRKADVAILDIYRGQAAKGGERVGERVLDDFQSSGFVPVVIHTNLPEGLEGRRSEFVRLVAKTDGLGKLAAEIDALFATHVPQINRAILNHLDRALCDYMWNFVTKQWAQLKDIADRPEFLRVLLSRLAYFLQRTDVERALAEAFDNYKPLSLDPEKVHPAEMYVMPTLSQDPVLGDIRKRKTGDTVEYLVVLWPTCDMVSSGGRKPKVDRVLCARTKLMSSCAESQEYATNATGKAREQLSKLMVNNRDRKFGSAESVHFLPAFLGIPDLVVEFRELEILSLDDVKKLESLATVASPYAEQISFRFDSYRGRVGVPDLDLDVVIGKLGPVAAGSARPPAAK